MSRGSQAVCITIDGKKYEVRKGITVLEAARKNGVFIPTLCTLEGLAPFGACRMCIVEIEGIKGFRTACTTTVEDGMKVRTNTPALKAQRLDILSLILSEHTSSCLICDIRKECCDSKASFRKAGVVTGCRACPADEKCELQGITERLGLEELKYPVQYRFLPVENYDPFYDRDYNLCILCGRCIRVCHEVRGVTTLAFKQRGYQTVVGTAYDRSLLDADCEFCGACVTVCPTGALAERSNRWDGKAEREQITTCALCGVGCRMRLQVKSGRVIGGVPDEGSLASPGQLCVKGRFCVNELVNNYKRLQKPFEIRAGSVFEIPREEAIKVAARKLRECPPEKFALRISPNCTNEGLYVAQKFARLVMRSHDVDTSARDFYGPGFQAYIDLMKLSVPLTSVHKAPVVLAVGLDTRFGRSVVGVELRKAIKRGVKLVTINTNDHNLAFDAHEWIRPEAGGELSVLRSLVELVRKKAAAPRRLPKKTDGISRQLEVVAGMLAQDGAPVILVGSQFAQRYDGRPVFETVYELARKAGTAGAGVITLPAQNNLAGSVLMGAYSELLPGGFSSSSPKNIKTLSKCWEAKIGVRKKGQSSGRKTSKKKVLYLIGENPRDGRVQADYLIYQNVYPPIDVDKTNLVIPSAAFTEVDGTFVNGEGRIQRVSKAVPPPGDALPDWKILCLIARELGATGFDYSNAKQIRDEIAALVDGFGGKGSTSKGPIPLEVTAEVETSGAGNPRRVRTTAEFPLVLDLAAAEHTYLGFSLAAFSGGAAVIFPEGRLRIHPDDAKTAGVSQGDGVAVISNGFEKYFSAELTDQQPKGTLHATLRQGEALARNQVPVRIRKKDV